MPNFKQFNAGPPLRLKDRLMTVSSAGAIVWDVWAGRELLKLPCAHALVAKILLDGDCHGCSGSRHAGQLCNRRCRARCCGTGLYSVSGYSRVANVARTRIPANQRQSSGRRAVCGYESSALCSLGARVEGVGEVV